MGVTLYFLQILLLVVAVVALWQITLIMVYLAVQEVVVLVVLTLERVALVEHLPPTGLVMLVVLEQVAQMVNYCLAEAVVAQVEQE